MFGVRTALFGAAAIACVAAAPAARAAQVYDVSYVTTTAPSSQWQYFNVGNLATDVAASGILFTFGADSKTDAGQTVLTLCDDIFHDIYVPETYTPELQYTAETLAGNTYFNTAQGGTGTFTAAQASLLGQLITEAQSIYASPTTPSLFGLNDKNSEIDAIQGAIWSIEYGVPVTDPGNSSINSAITLAENQYTPQGNGGLGLYTTGGTQDQVIGIGASPAPEPGTWAMMLVGLLGLGVVLRANRQRAKAEAQA
jgi:hypothetical protein